MQAPVDFAPKTTKTEQIVIWMMSVLKFLWGTSPHTKEMMENLGRLMSIIQEIRPPRIMVVGRCKAGKSSLINAMFGYQVAETSDRPVPHGEAEWKKYFSPRFGEREVIHILDTRGLNQAKQTDQETSQAIANICKAVKEVCPDIVLVLCKSTEVNAAIDADLDICSQVLQSIKNQYHRDVPVISVLTKCDELAPFGEWGSLDEQERQDLCQPACNDLSKHICKRESLSRCFKGVVPTVAYAKYDETGQMIENKDHRWNISRLSSPR